VEKHSTTPAAAASEARSDGMAVAACSAPPGSRPDRDYV
jgi:hypothetical protein